MRFKKIISTNPFIKTISLSFDKKLDNHSNKPKQATKEALSKRAPSVRHYERYFKGQKSWVGAVRLFIETRFGRIKRICCYSGETTQKMEHAEHLLQHAEHLLQSEFQQLEVNNQYLANEFQEKILSLIDKKFSFEPKIVVLSSRPKKLKLFELKTKTRENLSGFFDAKKCSVEIKTKKETSRDRYQKKEKKNFFLESRKKELNAFRFLF